MWQEEIWEAHEAMWLDSSVAIKMPDRYVILHLKSRHANADNTCRILCIVFVTQFGISDDVSLIPRPCPAFRHWGDQSYDVCRIRYSDHWNLHSRMFEPYFHVALPVFEYWLYLILIRWQKQEIDLCGFNQLVYKVVYNLTYASSVWEVLLRQILNLAKW